MAKAVKKEVVVERRKALCPLHKGLEDKIVLVLKNQSDYMAQHSEMTKDVTYIKTTIDNGLKTKVSEAHECIKDLKEKMAIIDDFQFRFRNSAGNMLYPYVGMDNGSYHTYIDNVSSLTGKPYLRHNSAGQTDITSMSCSYLTDVPATGLHLMSAKNGTTRNMKSVESGFNPNSITRVNIYRAY